VPTDIFLSHLRWLSIATRSRDYMISSDYLYHNPVSHQRQNENAVAATLPVLSLPHICLIPLRMYQLTSPIASIIIVSITLRHSRLVAREGRPCLNLLAIKPWGTCSIVIPIVPDRYPLRSASWRHQERHLSLAARFFDEPSTIYSGRWWI
jgi:hypothetical protein